MKTITRTTQMTILPEGDAIFSESAITLTIEDQAAGEYLKVCTGKDSGTILIDPAEWPQLREAIDAMLAEIANHERAQ